jgi:uncharacterized membrane protein
MVTLSTPIGREAASGNIQPGSAGDGVNVGGVERLLSVAGGGLLTLFGLRQRSLPGLGLAALGGALLSRGLTGHCPLYGALHVNTAEHHNPAAAVAAGRGFKIVQAVTVNRSAAELYRLWRDFENLPRFMSHLVSVKNEGERSHWVARAPAGTTVSWDAQIVTDEPGRLLAWRSLEGSTVATAGSVHFNERPNGRGTEVVVTLKYDPPAGKLGGWVAWLFGKEPGQQISEDLRRFKCFAETGEIATTEGQPSGRR